MHTIENDFFKIKITTQGAELTSIFCKQSGVEYLWQADPQYWNKHSPILFPIVGSLVNGSYIFNKKNYTLPRHGFAREKKWDLESSTSSSISFSLKSDEATLAIYPFQFEIVLSYTLNEQLLTCAYFVKNVDAKEMYFSLGAHPAFNLPILPTETFEDYNLVFEKDNALIRYKLDSKGLLSGTTDALFLNNHRLPLQHHLFEEDAIVLKNLQSNNVKVQNKNTQNGFEFSWNNFPHFGIWQPKNAPFLCLEPWQGFADHNNHNQVLENKEGVIRLAQHEFWQANWSISII